MGKGKGRHRQGAEAARADRAGEREIEKAQREYDLNKAAELQYGKLPELKRQLEEQEKQAEAVQADEHLLRDRVTDDEIARIVARWTGVPVTKLLEGEREKLLRLEDILHQRVIGQDEAVSKVAEAYSCGLGRAFPPPTGLSVRSCSWAPRVLAKPNWPKPWPRRCLTTRRTWCVST